MVVFRADFPTVFLNLIKFQLKFYLSTLSKTEFLVMKIVRAKCFFGCLKIDLGPVWRSVRDLKFVGITKHF